MTAGFALGPLVAGLLAQWAPDPEVVPYLPHIAFAMTVLVMLRDAPETVAASGAGSARPPRRSGGGVRFRRVVAPMAPWVFASPAIAFALLPSVVGAQHAADGLALVAVITALTAFAGVLIQPLGRRLDASPRGNRAATVGLVPVAAGLGLGAYTAHAQEVWMLVPCAIVLGCAYGLCLVGGLVEVQRMAGPDGLARLTAHYYALTYLGFAAPYLLALCAHLASYAALLSAAAVLALATAAFVGRQE
jgi:hypothetical protein